MTAGQRATAANLPTERDTGELFPLPGLNLFEKFSYPKLKLRDYVKPNM